VTLIRLGSVLHEIGDGFSVTRGRGWETYAWHKEQDGQAEIAARLGYPNAEALNREHDLTHCLLAFALGLPHSPTLREVARGKSHPVWPIEEATVLAVQQYARAMGVDIAKAAQGLCK
jgi:hypothetical protein